METYLSRTGPEDIRFMQAHLQTTPRLAAALNSDLELGLSPSALIENEELYGSNLRRVPEDHQMQQFWRILKEEITRVKVVAVVAAVVAEAVCGKVWGCADLLGGAAVVGGVVGASLGVKVGLRWRAYSLARTDSLGKKPGKVSVVRDGERFHIAENEIKVGDVVFVDFNEPVPVSGVLVSPGEVTVEEEAVGRGAQRKVALEGCLRELENKGELQLKIDF